MKNIIKSRRWLILSVAASLLLGGAACTGSKEKPRERQMQTVTDDLGRKVSVPTDVRRVISTAPSVTENIFAAGAGDRLVGVTTFCNYPEEAKNIAKIGDTMNPSMETIVALHPDIVFVSGASQLEAFTKTLEENQIAVYVLDPTSLGAVVDDLKKLGSLFDREDVSEQLIEDLWERQAGVEHRLGTEKGAQVPVKVFVQISKEPLFTVGKGGFLNELVETAGGVSVTRDVPSAFPKLSKETAAALNPDVIILSNSEDNGEANEAFKKSPAVMNGRVYKINADIISRPGPRLFDALEQIAKLLHPEKFKVL